MPVPSKGEMMEEFAGQIGMSEKELLEFCLMEIQYFIEEHQQPTKGE